MEAELGYDDVEKVHIERGNQGFGFNIKGPTQAGGTLQAINGRLYPPLQYISHVDEDGAAWNAGLRCWDRVLSVNGSDMRGSSHNEVVKSIIRGGATLDIIVIHLTDEEAARLQRLEDEISSQKGKGKSAAIFIRDFNNVPNEDGKGSHTLKARFAWHIFPNFPPKKMNGIWSTTLKTNSLEDRKNALERYLQSVYNVEDIRNSQSFLEFLQPTSYCPPNATKLTSTSSLKSTTTSSKTASSTAPLVSATPKTNLPSKTSVSSTKNEGDQELIPEAVENAGIEDEDQYSPTFAKQDQLKNNEASKPLHISQEKASAVSESEDEDEQEKIVAGINTLDTTKTAPSKLTFDVLLPTNEMVSVSLSADASIGDVRNAILGQIGVSSSIRSLFSLFESISDERSSDVAAHTFELRIPDNEVASKIQRQLLLRRWLFAKDEETAAEDCPPAVALLVHQALHDIKQGRLYCSPKKKKKLLGQDDILAPENHLAVLSVIRKLPMYGGVQFPICTKKGEEVIVTVTLERIVIQKTSEDGTALTDEDNILVIETDKIEELRRMDESIELTVSSEDEAETIQLQTQHAIFMEESIQRVLLEIKWQNEGIKFFQ
eukprot:gene10328-2469_t